MLCVSVLSSFVFCFYPAIDKPSSDHLTKTRVGIEQLGQHKSSNLVERQIKVLLNKVNSQCDGDRDSYDAMVLLTGRYDFQDLKGASHTLVQRIHTDHETNRIF